MTLELHYILVRSNYVRKLRESYVSFLFVIVKYFHYVTITLFICLMQLRFWITLEIGSIFCTFELRMEKMLQLRFAFVRHCNVFFITSQLRCLFVRCNYIF